MVTLSTASARLAVERGNTTLENPSEEEREREKESLSCPESENTLLVLLSLLLKEEVVDEDIVVVPLLSVRLVFVTVVVAREVVILTCLVSSSGHVERGAVSTSYSGEEGSCAARS